MEITRSGLIAEGLTEEMADSIVQAHKAAINGKYVPKGRFDELNDRMKEAEERAARLEPLEHKNSDLAKRISELEATLKASKDETERTLNAERVKFAIDGELRGIAQDAAIVAGLLDMSKISYKDGQLTGFSQQLDALRKDKPFLFKDERKEASSSGNTSGVFLFGNTPASSDVTTRKAQTDSADNFGATLAKSKVEAQARAAKGQQAYFSGF